MTGWLLVTEDVPSVSARASAPQTGSTAYTGLDSNAACAHCHKEIYERYRTTPMANASGAAADGFLPGGFTHAESGVSYRMVKRDGKAFLAFERTADVNSSPGNANGSLKGQRELSFFIGSGKRGRTYLYEQEGFWFEIPVNWYSKKRTWDMAPNYLHVKEMPLTLPIDPGCVRCHSSEAQPSMPEARNRYATTPFLENGITCTACHGDATAHLASGGRTAMMKIGELPPVERDSICLSCHLEGQQVVVHQDKKLVDFRPGQSIFNYASFFVRQSQAGVSERATSQWEALLESGCKRGAGDKLTCTTCHDPHGSTAAMSVEDRVMFYRRKCLQCHDPSADEATGLDPRQAGGAKARSGFALSHHPENPNCASCHMPRARAEDIAHEQVTDHRIPRLPNPKSAASTRNPAGPLVAIGTAVGTTGESNDRDLGLAYAFAASRGDRDSAERAMQLLRVAEGLPESAGDSELHKQLGFLDQLAGEKDAAVREYQMALQADAHDAIAAGNLGLIKAGDRQYPAAMELWERAFLEDPVQLKAGMNLATVECGVGKKEAALGTLDRILAFSPDDRQARELTMEIRSGRQVCGSR